MLHEGKNLFTMMDLARALVGDEYPDHPDSWAAMAGISTVGQCRECPPAEAEMHSKLLCPPKEGVGLLCLNHATEENSITSKEEWDRIKEVERWGDCRGCEGDAYLSEDGFCGGCFGDVEEGRRCPETGELNEKGEAYYTEDK